MTWRPMRYSSSSDSAEDAGLPMSGRSLAPWASAIGGRASWSASIATSRCFRRRLLRNVGIADLDPLGPGEFRPREALEGIRCEIRQSRALAADQGDVAGVIPAA